MKVYGQKFGVQPNSPYPGDPCGYASLKHMVSCYEEFVQDCEEWGQTPSPHWVYLGDVAEVENANGVWLYPDYPDRIIEVGPRGGIVVKRT